MSSISKRIKDKALELGFSHCGLTPARKMVAHETRLDQWLSLRYNASMAYMERNPELRLDPSMIIENGKSVICVALNYYPRQPVELADLRIARYAFGKDYHSVLRDKLLRLLSLVQELCPGARGRCFVDSAPLLEKALAVEAGLGWIGKNSLLLLPRAGSFFFLGELVVDVELDYDSPHLENFCGRCTRCIDACPSGAIVSPGVVDSRKCISCATIESKELDENIISRSTFLFGCDVCQDVCPWNRFAVPHAEPELDASELVRKLSLGYLQATGEPELARMARGTALERAGAGRLKAIGTVLSDSKH